MAKIIENDKTTGTVDLYDAFGNKIGEEQKPTVILTVDEARTLRAYKNFLLKYGLREALYCNTCGMSTTADGMRSFVRPNQIGMICRHRMLFYQGYTD